MALGGGGFINKNIRENILKSAISIWLDVDVKILTERITWNKKRPLLIKENRLKKFNELYDERKKIYQLANHKIACNGFSKENKVGQPPPRCFRKCRPWPHSIGMPAWEINFIIKIDDLIL